MNDTIIITDQKKFIRNYVSSQATPEIKAEIISILNKTGVIFSHNVNGRFYNLSLIKDEIIDELYDLCQSNIIPVKTNDKPITKKLPINKESENIIPYSVDKIYFSPIDNFIIDLSKEHLRL